GPRFAAVFVAAVLARMGVLHFYEIEELFPVGSLFLERRGAVADFDPPCRAIGEQPRILHVAEILVASHGAMAERFRVDGREQIGFAAGFYFRSNEITHGLALSNLASILAPLFLENYTREKVSGIRPCFVGIFPTFLVSGSDTGRVHIDRRLDSGCW